MCVYVSVVTTITTTCTCKCTCTCTCCLCKYFIHIIIVFHSSTDVITCQSLTLDIEYTSQTNITTTCIPITSCTMDTTINTITWMKSFFPNDRYHQLYSGVYIPPSYTLLDTANDANVISLSSVTVNGTVINNATINIMDPDMNSVGFYEVYDGSGVLLHTFTVFSELRIMHVEYMYMK